MTYNYSKLKDRASGLLAHYGDALEIINASKSVLSTGVSVRGTLKTGNIPESIVGKAEAVFFLPADMVGLVKNNYVRSGNDIYKIIGTEPAQPGDTNILTRVYVSR